MSTVLNIDCIIITDRLQSELLQQDLHNEDEILIAIAGIKQVMLNTGKPVLYDLPRKHWKIVTSQYEMHSTYRQTCLMRSSKKTFENCYIRQVVM